MNKKTWILVLLFIGIGIIAIAGAYIGRRNVQFCTTEDGEVAISVQVNSYSEIIKPYYSDSDEVYYYFLPSVLCDKRICNDFCETEIYIEGQEIGRYSSFEWNTEETYQMEYADREIDIRFKLSSDIPVLFISTDTGSMDMLNSDKSYQEHADLTIIEADSTVSYSGGVYIKGRGNSTYRQFQKKPFNIKLDEAAGLLGMEADKDWSLLANSWDYSYMNNKLAFDMANRVGFRYVPDAEYADVYCNGDYWGMYLVTERIEVDTERIDITDLEFQNEIVNVGSDILQAEKFDYGNKRGVLLENIPNDITGGYLLERDYRLAPDYGKRVFTTSYFETGSYGTVFNIKSPEYASKEEVEYISELTSQMEQAIRSVDGYSENGKYYLDYIDLDSWVKWYMLAEIAYDLDKAATNTYIYKDADVIDTKFYMGPVWDYDCRFGGTEIYSSAEELTKLSGDWFHHLYDREEFFKQICLVWDSCLKKYLQEEAYERIDSWQNLIYDSVEMDIIRWNRASGYPQEWPSVYDGEFVDTYSFEDSVFYLKDWLNRRCEFLDDKWKLTEWR